MYIYLYTYTFLHRERHTHICRYIHIKKARLGSSVAELHVRHRHKPGQINQARECRFQKKSALFTRRTAPCMLDVCCNWCRAAIEKCTHVNSQYFRAT